MGNQAEVPLIDNLDVGDTTLTFLGNKIKARIPRQLDICTLPSSETVKNTGNSSDLDSDERPFIKGKRPFARFARPLE